MDVAIADVKQQVAEILVRQDLTAADGAQIVDSDGKTVTIKAGDEIKVQGDSDITVTVSGEYTMAFELPENAQLNTKVLDRETFDKYYETSTAFGSNKTKE